MKAYHYSATPFIFDELRIYEPDPNNFKPRGLWLSIEEGENPHGWKEWCESEGWNIGGLAHRTEIHFADNANILHLQSPLEIRRFTQRYSYSSFQYSLRCINWTKVAKEYQGIIIAPYQWECRLDHSAFWYYSWDCASGCVWDLSAIKVLSEVSVS